MSWENKLKLANNRVQQCAGMSKLGGGLHCKQAARRTTGPLEENQPGRRKFWASRLSLDKSTRSSLEFLKRGMVVQDEQ